MGQHHEFALELPDDLLEIGGLGKEVVEACLQGLVDIDWCRVSLQGTNVLWGAACLLLPLAQALHALEAVHERHHNV